MSRSHPIPDLKGNGKIIKKSKAMNSLLKVIIKVTLRLISDMDKVNFIGKMVNIIQVNGTME